MNTAPFYRIIEYAEELCRGHKLSVSDCEGCPMYWINEKGNQECDLEDVIKEVEEELKRL